MKGHRIKMDKQKCQYNPGKCMNNNFDTNAGLNSHNEYNITQVRGLKRIFYSTCSTFYLKGILFCAKDVLSENVRLNKISGRLNKKIVYQSYATLICP